MASLHDMPVVMERTHGDRNGNKIVKTVTGNEREDIFPDEHVEGQNGSRSEER